MNIKAIISLLLLTVSCLFAPLAYADGTLSEFIRIKSDALGYDLQYQVYVPNNTNPDDQLPTLYITDGAAYAKKGRMIKALNDGITEGKIKPVIAIFVDARNPDNLKNNRRNEQFFCEQNYVDFFTTELIPAIDKGYSTSALREHRVILGVSFGGFNAGCFGLMATPYFGGVAMNSPAHTRFVRHLQKHYKRLEKKNIKIYMSVGTDLDNKRAVRSFRTTLKNKGYDLTFMQTDKGHNWNNWTPLLPKVLETFFASNQDASPSKGE
ncbi:MAG: alpha/beta hydrolase-fold protein [Hellea sp.]